MDFSLEALGGTHLGYGDGSVTITGTFSDIPVSELTYEDTANGGGVVAVVLGTPMSIDLRAEASGEYFYIDDTPCCWTSGFGTAEITLKFFEAGPGAPVRILYAPPGPEPIPEPSTWGAESCSPRSGV